MDKILVDLPTIIKTPRLYLKVPQAGFGQQLHKAVSEDYTDYVKWLNWSSHIPTIDQLEAECRRHHAEFITREFIRYLIIDQKSNQVVGRCAFPTLQSNWSIPQFGISYFISKSKRLNGFATEATYAMTMLAFKILSAKKVEIFCESENINSIKVPVKLGFEHEYTQRGGWPRLDEKLAILQTFSLFSECNLARHYKISFST